MHWQSCSTHASLPFIAAKWWPCWCTPQAIQSSIANKGLFLADNVRSLLVCGLGIPALWHDYFNHYEAKLLIGDACGRELGNNLHCAVDWTVISILAMTMNKFLWGKINFHLSNFSTGIHYLLCRTGRTIHAEKTALGCPLQILHAHFLHNRLQLLYGDFVGEYNRLAAEVGVSQGNPILAWKQ